jgi:ATP-dependent NAD(P)H-hydrate dehydratase
MQETVAQLLERVHIVILGPGLSRDASMQNAAASILSMAQERKIPSIIDGVN